MDKELEQKISEAARNHRAKFKPLKIMDAHLEDAFIAGCKFIIDRFKRQLTPTQDKTNPQ